MDLKKASALGLALSGLLTAITSAAATGTSSADNLERVGDFARRLRVTPNGSAVAAGEDYADVPVLLRLSTSIAGFDYSQFRQNGQDMMILDEAANELPFEIESWNPEGESLVWVKVKNFTSATKLTVYYGADAANEANDPKDVWSAYAGVWHLDETEGMTVADATGRGGNGTCKGNSAALESGVFAGGRHNRNKGNGETSAASGIVFDGMKSVRHNGKITLSAWVKRYHTNLCWDHLFYNKTGSSGVGGFASELYGSGNYGQIAVIGSGDNASGVYIEHGMSAADTWYHVAMVYDVQSAYLYNNGAKKGGGVMKSSMWDNGQAFSLGNDIDTNGSPWDGAFDEFRVSLGAMSEARVALEYKTMMPDAVTMTAEENDTADLPVPEALAITPAGENAVKVAAGLKAGSATRVTVKLSDGREAVLTETAVGAGWRGEHTFTGLTPETIFLVSVRYENAAGDDITLAVDDAWYNGPLTITAQSDALEETLEPGRFVFMRATGEASVRYPLTIAYTVGGSATPDADYTALSGTVTIPAGEASATVEVQPLKNPLVDSRINVTVTVADGFYPPTAASATLAIRNFRSPSIVKFTKRMEIAVAADKYTGSALKDFPVPVRLREGENGFSYSDFRLEGGADMAFFDADGNVYPHEIDTWNPQGESLVWVKVPSFSASTRFFIGYSAAVANESKAREVWSAYTGVWHMGEAAAAATTLYDATAHQLNGTYGALSSTMEGMLGNGRMMTTTSAKPSSAGRTLVPHQASMNVDAQYVYASMWVKYTGGTWAYLITRKNDDQTRTWGFQMNTSTKAMRFYGDGGTCQELSWGGSDFPTEWTKLDLVMSGGTYGLYVNGEKKAGKTGQNWPNNNGSTAGIAIGAPVGDTWSAFYGAMDEVRLTSAFTPSDDWIRAQYLLESDATALTYGTVGTVSTGDMTIVDSARVILKDEVPTVTARLLSGTATVSLVLRDEAGVETRLPLGTGPVTAPHEFELPLTALPGSGWYDLATIAEDVSGDCDEKTWAVRVKKDAIAVGKAFDADATALRTGAFVISRPADDARLDEALEVPYVLAGSLVNGSDYTKLSGKVTIPAGKTSVQVPVEPLIEGKTGDVTLTLAAANMTAVPGRNRATVKVRADGKAESRVVLKVKGYSGAAVENVPVLVRLTEGFAGFSYGKLRNPSTGSDLHFQDERGNELPFEIDEWHPDGESVIWVRMSRLARGARLAVCYGGDAIASEAIPENRSETWAEQTAVYHMIMNAGSNNRYGNSAGTNIDASRGWNNNSVVQGSGVSGFGQLISSGVYNAKDNHGVLFNNESEAFKSTDGTFTASCWIKYTQGQVPAYDRILCHKKKYSDTTGWEFMLYDKEPTKLRFRASGEAAADMEVFATPVNDGEWHYLAFVFSGSTVKVYENGVLRATGSTGTTTYTTAPQDVKFAIGNTPGTSEISFKGTVDEVRWAPVALSADRIRADYETVANANFFVASPPPGFIVIVR